MDVRPICCVSLMLILSTAGLAAAASNPLFEMNDVFVGGQDGIHTYRIPSVICTRKGTVLVFCEGRRDRQDDGSPTHLVLKRCLGDPVTGLPSRVAAARPALGDRSKARPLAWEPIQVLLSSKENDAYMNPVPVIDQSTGVIFLFVNHYAHYGKEEDLGRGDVQTLLLKSSDEGATWSDPVDLTPSVGRVALGPGIAIETTHGLLIAPTYAGVIYSGDRGKSWKAGSAVDGPLNETQIAELADGSLMLNLRGAPIRTIFISKDYGRTWGPPRKDPALTDPEQWNGCQSSLIRYTRIDDGYTKNRLLFAHPADLKSRFNLTVMMSYDEGKTWPVSKLVYQGPGSYSSMTVFPDGTIGLVFETGSVHGQSVKFNEKLSFVHFNLDWLTEGSDILARTTGP